MKKTYIIETRTGIYEVKAESLSIGSEGLKFYINGESVAWFLYWENWRIVE